MCLVSYCYFSPWVKDLDRIPENRWWVLEKIISINLWIDPCTLLFISSWSIFVAARVPPKRTPKNSSKATFWDNLDALLMHFLVLLMHFWCKVDALLMHFWKAHQKCIKTAKRCIKSVSKVHPNYLWILFYIFFAFFLHSCIQFQVLGKISSCQDRPFSHHS